MEYIAESPKHPPTSRSVQCTVLLLILVGNEPLWEGRARVDCNELTKTICRVVGGYLTCKSAKPQLLYCQHPSSSLIRRLSITWPNPHSHSFVPTPFRYCNNTGRTLPIVPKPCMNCSRCCSQVERVSAWRYRLADPLKGEPMVAQTCHDRAPCILPYQSWSQTSGICVMSWQAMLTVRDLGAPAS
jgi:hypothetical protein